MYVVSARFGLYIDRCTCKVLSGVFCFGLFLHSRAGDVACAGGDIENDAGSDSDAGAGGSAGDGVVVSSVSSADGEDGGAGFRFGGTAGVGATFGV